MSEKRHSAARLMYVEPSFVFAVLDVIVENGGHIASVSVPLAGTKGAAYREIWFFSNLHNEQIAHLARQKPQHKQDEVIHEFDPFTMTPRTR